VIGVWLLVLFFSNSHYEANFGVSSAEDAGYTKIVFLKAFQSKAFKKVDFYNENCYLFLLWQCQFCLRHKAQNMSGGASRRHSYFGL